MSNNIKKLTVLICLMLPILVFLGFWQLGRAEEKRAIEQLFAQRQQADTVPIESLINISDLRYRRVELKGQFISDKTIFLDNRIYKSQFGYEIISPFKLKSNDVVVLVNRGWLAGDPGRRSLPRVEMIVGDVQLFGDIYVPEGSMMNFVDEVDTEGWPKVVQSLRVESLADEFSADVFPYSVRLDEGTTAVFQTNWLLVNVSPAKHTGYAVQWFAMACALICIYIVALWKARKALNKE